MTYRDRYGIRDRQVWRCKDKYECAEFDGGRVAYMDGVEAGMDCRRR